MRHHFSNHPSWKPPAVPAAWPTPEYEAMTHPGYVRVAFEDPRDYTGEGTHYLTTTHELLPLSAAFSAPVIDSQFENGKVPDPRRHILRAQEESWPTPEYNALPTPKGFIRTGEFADVTTYRGKGTHYLMINGFGAGILTPTIKYSGDPRRYILRRARVKTLVETEEVRRAQSETDWVEYPGGTIAQWPDRRESRAVYPIWREEPAL